MLKFNEHKPFRLKIIEKVFQDPYYKSNIYHMSRYGMGLYEEIEKEKEEDIFHHYDKKEKIQKGSIPEGTKNVLIGKKYNQPFELDDLPKSVKRIEFEDYSSFNQYFYEEKEGIEEIIFNMDSKYNKDFLQEALPKTLKKLQLPYKYSAPIKKGALPDSLHTLVFSMSVPEIEEGALPNNIEIIYFGIITGNPLDNQTKFLGKIKQLPSQLKELYITTCYDGSLKGILPEGLKKLCIRNKYTFEEGELPESLEYLYIPSKIEKMITKKTFPKNLKYLYIGCDPKWIEEIPDTIRFLSFNREWTDIKIPDSVEYLSLPILFEGSLKELLPKNLKYLKLNEHIEKKWSKGDLPETLKYLDISRCISGWKEEEVTNEDLPPNLEYLESGRHYIKGVSREIMYYYQEENNYQTQIEYLDCKITIKPFEHKNIFDFKEKMISRKEGYHRDLKIKVRDVDRLQKYMDGGHSMEEILSFMGYYS